MHKNLTPINFNMHKQTTETKLPNPNRPKPQIQSEPNTPESIRLY